MLVLITAASIACFMLAFWLLGIVPVARDTIATAQTAMQTMRDPALDELAKEKAVQSAALRMLVHAASLIGRSLLALAAAAVPVLAAHWTGLMPAAQSLAFMERWEVIVIATLVVLAGYVGVRRLWPN
jgi:hypothetical protein